MPKLIPPYLSRTSYFGEAKLFALLNSASSIDDCCVYHSLNLVRHNHKREGEADFVIIGPRGILVVEVKGATKIIRKDGRWQYITKNKKYESTESPFQQAKENFYSLVERITTALKLQVDLKKIGGYGVAFPNLIFNEQSPEWDSEIVIDENRLGHIAEFCDELFIYWRKKSGIDDRFEFSKETLKKIQDFVRGDFEVVESPLSFADEARAIINKLTNEQIDFLDVAIENPRIIVKGYAGTGKTILAIEQAKRMASKGKKVLFLCFNRLLSSNLKCELREYSDQVCVSTIDSFVLKTLRENGIGSVEKDFDERWRNFKTVLNDNNSIIRQYDYLVLDEAQDYIDSSLLELIEKTIVGGIAIGNWTIFYDDEVQSKLYEHEESGQCLKQLFGNATKLSLNKNCRNPRKIVEETYRVTNLPVPRDLIVDLPQYSITYSFFGDDYEEAVLVSDRILSLLHEGFPANSITLLTLTNKPNLLREVFKLVGHKINTIIDLRSYFSVDVESLRFNIDKRSIGYSTIQAFKGLENDNIIISGISSLDSKLERALFYVGTTRSKLTCNVVADKKLKSILISGGSNGK
jgi:ATP:corrinoid adenosyltransferase